MLGAFVFLALNLYIAEVTAYQCYLCPTTTNPLACGFLADCPNSNGCFSQTWIAANGFLHYQKGCLTIDTTCDALESYYCLNSNTFDCCQGNRCNQRDPLLSWAPPSPSNVIAQHGTNYITVSWESRCLGHHSFRVGYRINSGGISSLQSQYVNVTSDEVTLSSLLPGTSYIITVESIYLGVSSQPITLTASTTPLAITTTLSTVRSTCWITGTSPTSPSAEVLCSNPSHKCFSKIQYVNAITHEIISRGCMSEGDCARETEENAEACKPGVIGKECHFCCEGPSCNSYNWTYSQLTCEDVALDERILCGWIGINEVSCFARGCCYNPDPTNTTSAWCHYRKHKKGGKTSLTSASLEVWAIIVIVIAILILLVIIAVVTYCCRKKRKESTSGFYDVYSVPNKRKNEPRRTTTAREAYDNTVSEI